MLDFAGKTAFVTGAASGIGRATALEFARLGARVATVDRDEAGLLQTQKMLEERGAENECRICNVTQAGQVRAAVATVVERWGSLDCVVNSAGVEGIPQKMLEEDDALYDRIMDVNVRGLWLCMKIQIEQMLKQPDGGSIVNLSSSVGRVGSPWSALYSASKHATIGLSRSAALQYARKGIRINVVCPSGVATPMAERIRSAASGGKETTAPGANYPLGRYSTAEEIASGILWLSSPGAASAIGSVLSIDAGFTAA